MFTQAPDNCFSAGRQVPFSMLYQGQKSREFQSAFAVGKHLLQARMHQLLAIIAGGGAHMFFRSLLQALEAPQLPLEISTCLKPLLIWGISYRCGKANKIHIALEQWINLQFQIPTGQYGQFLSYDDDCKGALDRCTFFCNNVSVVSSYEMHMRSVASNLSCMLQMPLFYFRGGEITPC